MRTPLRSLVAVLALIAAGGAAAADPAAWLLQASDAARQTSYQGTVVYRDARTLEVLRVVHRQKDGQVQERLTSLTGEPRDLLRQGDAVACATAGQPTVGAGGLPQRLFPALSIETMAQAQAHYTFRDLGEGRVAGRACRSVALAPRDEFRYGYEICADSATAVPLKVSLLDPRGRAVEELIFTEVSFPKSIDDTAFAAPAALQEFQAAPVQVVTAADGGQTWRLERLPPGFREIMRSRQAAPEGRGIVEHVLLSDGLSAVSVFGAVTAAPADWRGLSNIGAVHAYGRTVGDFHVTVVGEVPASTVQLIGDGFQPASAAR